MRLRFPPLYGRLAFTVMSSENKQPSPERDQTDESLRAEREKADDTIRQKLAAIGETADAVLEKARARADSVLAAARAKSDRQLATRPVTAETVAAIQRDRTAEDQTLRRDRSEADQTRRAERAEQTALLESEREETDKDLSIERTQSDKVVARRDELLGIVSHDLRNMLGVMVNFAWLIAKAESRENHREEVLAYVQRIHQSSARMNRLIGDLVDLASIAAGALAVATEVGDPTPVVTEAVDAFQAQAEASGLSLTAEIAPQLPLVALDAARILQVLVNLLSNAIKFTPPHGRVVVRVEPTGDELRFAVSDTGVGIPSDKLEAVFERFLQVTPNDRRGVGLGLYISKCIVQGHGGRIWAESRPGAGSTICFTLPITAARSNSSVKA